MSDLRVQAEAAAQAVLQLVPERPVAGIILGSGLGALAETVMPTLARIPYRDLPHFAVAAVAGHTGQLVVGRVGGKLVWIMNGRPHFYEGWTFAQVTFPVRVMQAAGLSTLVVTNAAGGLNPTFQVGDLMLITDQINLVGLSGDHPLVGPNDPLLGPRFPAMHNAYDPGLRKLAGEAAERLGFATKQGVYVMVSGPSYETPAEVRMLRLLGADAVGMSTASEVTVARHACLRVLGISCITNALGESAEEPAHEAVLAAAQAAEPRLVALIEKVIKDMAPI